MTLTYVYADQTAVLGPLATYAEPHAYDLCEAHSERLSAPRGWEVLRLAQPAPPGPSNDDLLALADAVREAGRPQQPRRVAPDQETGRETGRATTCVPAPRGWPARSRRAPPRPAPT